jgi:hypothetical protein
MLDYTATRNLVTQASVRHVIYEALWNLSSASSTAQFYSKLRCCSTACRLFRSSRTYSDNTAVLINIAVEACTYALEAGDCDIPYTADLPEVITRQFRKLARYERTDNPYLRIDWAHNFKPSTQRFRRHVLDVALHADFQGGYEYELMTHFATTILGDVCRDTPWEDAGIAKANDVIRYTDCCVDYDCATVAIGCLIVTLKELGVLADTRKRSADAAFNALCDQRAQLDVQVKDLRAFTYVLKPPAQGHGLRDFYRSLHCELPFFIKFQADRANAMAPASAPTSGP